MTWAPLLLSFEVALCATLLAGVLGIALAGLLSRSRLPGAELLEVLVTAPMVLPPTVLGYYLLTALGRHSGVGRLVESLTGAPIVFTRAGAVVAATVAALPFVVKGARAAMESLDDRLFGAAQTLGAGPLRIFFTITVPLALPGIAAGLMLGFARALGDFGITLMVAGDIPELTQTASLAIYDAVQAGRDAEASGLVVLLTGLAIVALWGVNALTRRRRHGW